MIRTQNQRQQDAIRELERNGIQIDETSKAPTSGDQLLLDLEADYEQPACRREAIEKGGAV